MPSEKPLDPVVSLVKISKHATKDLSQTQFMARIFTTTLTRCLAPCPRRAHQKQIMRMPHEELLVRCRLRAGLISLLQRLDARPWNRPPYDQVVADELRQWLGAFQQQTDHDFSTDFEALLATVEKRAAEHWASVEEVAQEEAARRAAEAQEDSEKEKKEWDVVEEKEAEEEWEVI